MYTHNHNNNNIRTYSFFKRAKKKHGIHTKDLFCMHSKKNQSAYIYKYLYTYIPIKKKNKKNKKEKH